MKLIENKYKDCLDFAEDVRLVFLNSIVFTFCTDELHKTSKKLLNLFEKLWLDSNISKIQTSEISPTKKRKRFKTEEVLKKFKETTNDFILTSIYDSLESPKESREIQPKGLNHDLYRYQIVRNF